MKNVVLITIDALKNDLVGSDFRARPSMTPCIDTYFGSGARFHNVHSVSFPTQFAMPGLLAGQLPLSRGGYHLGITGRGPTVAQWFKERGYATFGVTTDYHTSACYGYGEGFDEYIDLHDVSWHANGVKRNDIDFLGTRAASFGIPAGAVEKAILGKLQAYIPFAAKFVADRRAATAVGLDRKWSPQIDNWNFDELSKLLDAECSRLASDCHSYAMDVRNGRSPWFSTLPGLRFGPHYPDADYALDYARKIVAAATHPFFLWVHLTDVHGTLTEDLSGMRPLGPFDSRLRARTDILNNFGRLAQRYEGQGERSDWRAVRFTDACIGEFLDELSGRLPTDGLVVALSSDHGDHRAERYGYGASYGVSDHLNLYDELTHVPLLIRGGISGDYGELLSTMDIGKLLLDLSQGSEPGQIVPKLARDYVISEHAYPGTCLIPYKPLKIAVRSLESKVVYFDPPSERFGQPEITQAYDLLADPLEKRNIRERVTSNARLRSLAGIARERAGAIRRESPTV